MIRNPALLAVAFTLACLGARPAAAQRMGGAQTTAIAGDVFDSLRTNAPLAGVAVIIIDLNKYATADERGRFHFDSLTPGRYRLSFLHPVLDSLHLSAGETTVEAIAGTTTVVRLTTPSPATLYARVCPAPRPALTGFVIGQVRDIDDESPIAGAIVSSSWDEFVVANGRAALQTTGHRAATAASGGFVFCGVPTDAPFTLRAAFGGASAGPIELTLGALLVASVDLAVTRAPAGPGRLATLRGTVRRADGNPIAGAIVSSDAANEPVRADTAGRFTLAGIVPGTRVVEVKGLGLTPITVVMDFRSGSAIDTSFTLIRPAQPLTPVAVTARTDEIDRGEFDRRRRSSAGYFATATDIMKFTPSDLGDVFQRVPAVRLQPGPPRAGVSTKQVTMMGSGGNPYCVPTFFVDGVEFAGGGVGSFAEVMDAVKPEWVKGIEVYRSAGPIPPRFDRSSRTGCGSIVVWTR